MSKIDDPNELPEQLRLSSDRLSVLTELSGRTEEELRVILRPHNDADAPENDGDVMLLRRRLEGALEGLTKLEIACELGLYGLNAAGTEAYLTMLAPGWTKLIESDAFLRYVGAYLYFGVRILAGRLVPPPWWTNAPEGVPGVLEPFVNKRPLQLAVPPVVGEAAKSEQALRKFLGLQVN